ncbi:DoxX family protein [Methylosinus sp. PW1]|uniref:DoxX family protein n=1 Tax=Methylosinus sp. PW1 TaxID=107636 RepID=UPI00055F7D94|nr:DoxX family protein [Methylosinus sp. PW1]
MTPSDTAATRSWMRWTGYGLTALVGLFMTMDVAMKLAQLPIVLETTVQLGWPTTTVVSLGLVLLISTALYVIPSTSILGAILLTAYLGGAVATHARIGSPLFSHTLFGVYVGIALWGALYLRNDRLRSLIPISR